MAVMDRFYPFFASTVPLVFAHRGGGALAPENTIAAFDNARRLGADGLEIDVHLSRDGVPVVHHDRTLDRTTSLRGAVAALDARELERAAVPVLADVLARYETMRIIVELKRAQIELARAVVSAIRAAGAVDRVCVGSFSRNALQAVRVLDSGIATSASKSEVRWAVYRSWCRWPRWATPRADYAGYQVPEYAGSTRVVSKQFVDAAHARGLPVQVWTVDTEADAKRLLALGVDALITDRPDVIVPMTKRL
jgi:glycerophosphoryl diester phosphodiesterase